MIRWSEPPQDSQPTMVCCSASLVASMGNSNTNQDLDPRFPSDYPWIIGVGATSCPVGYLGDPACIGVDAKSPWCDYASETELAAPGEDILSRFPSYFGLLGLNSGVVREVAPNARSFTHTMSEGSPPGDTGVRQIVSGEFCRVNDVPPTFGELVLCERGQVDFRAKILNAYARGALGVIIRQNPSSVNTSFLSHVGGRTIGDELVWNNSVPSATQSDVGMTQPTLVECTLFPADVCLRTDVGG
jgi:hypothetical protein